MKCNTLILTVCLTAYFLSTTQISTAQKLSDEIVLEAAKPLIEDEVVQGISIGYIQDEKYGTVHLGHTASGKEKANNKTLYEIASISKVFTSLLMADAVVRGEIELAADANADNEAGIKLPSHDGRSISWLDLSTHRSGLPRLPDNLEVTSAENPYRLYDSKKAAAALADFELPRSPGKSQEYSNFAVSLMGYMLGQKAGNSYQELLQQRITKPLRMFDCTVAMSDDQQKRLATPHVAVGSPTPDWTCADLPGAGGIRASMKDMMRFARAQLYPPKDKLGEAIELAWKQRTAGDASGPPMGLGWFIMGDGQTRWHNGMTAGSSSFLLVNRKEKLAIVVLCNTATFDLDQFAIQLMQRATGKGLAGASAAEKKKAKAALPIDAEHRARLVGKYKLNSNFIFDVKDRGGRLMVGITNQPTQEVFPDSKTRWSYKSVNATLEFKLRNKGPAKSLVLHQNGLKQTAKRMAE